MNTTLRFAACAALATLGVAAHAGRPLVTEDAGVLDRGDCEFESYVARVRADDATARGGVVQLGCGVGARSQVALALSRERADGATAHGATLLGKTVLLVPDDDAAAAITLAWQLAAARADGRAWRGDVAALTAVASVPLADALTLHANLGTSRSRIEQRSTTGWAVALEHAGSAGIDLMTELFADDRDRDPWLQVAARWAVLPDRVYLDASWGVQAAPSRPKALTLGLKVPF